MGLLAVMLAAGGLSAGPVTNAPAFVPENPAGMERLMDPHSPANRAARHFQRGANVGNYLEVPPGAGWGLTVAADEYRQMQREGFGKI
jgi:hypothetical protein